MASAVVTTDATERRASTPRGRGSLLALPALAPVLAVLVLGLGSAVLQSVGLMPLAGQPAFTTSAYSALASPAVADGMRISLAIAAASTAIAVVLGLTAALLVHRIAPRRGFLALLAAATVPVPHLVGAIATGLLLSDSGLVSRLLGADPTTFPQLIAGPWWVGVVAEYAWKESAFVALVVLVSLSQRERELSEAAAVLGASAWERFRRVTLPLASPALVVSATLSAAYVVGSYEVSWLLGRSYPEPLPVLAYRLFTDVDLDTRPEAMAVAVLTVGVAGAIALVGTVMLRRTAAAR